MTFNEKIKELRKAREDNRLIIFVGSGISSNSGIPTWSGLIKRFAMELGYDNCKKCNFVDNACPKTICPYRYEFSQDEYLKIPQYFFDNDESLNHSKYFGVINESLSKKSNPNPLHDIIMKLNPRHIITTNYDKLIEDTQSPNSLLYKVIIEDKDLLTQISCNYIIKMHGDIEKTDTIVLKESDYLNYQQKHILIETYIKSLLIDNTFLFIGYSLNDYNLKLIINWIEYLSKEHNVKENRPKNFIVQYNNEPTMDYLEKYFFENNIDIISTYDLPKELNKNILKVELDEKGKDIYKILDCIFDENNDYLIDTPINILYEKYKIFEKPNRISFQDIRGLYSLGRVQHFDKLLFFHDEKKFGQLREIIETDNEKANFIKKVLIKTGIEEIQLGDNSVFVRDRTEVSELEDDTYFCLEQSNEFFKIIAKLDDEADELVKAYYYYVICPDAGNAFIAMENAKKTMYKCDDYFRLLIYYYNAALIKQYHFQQASKEYQEFKVVLNNIPEAQKSICRYMEKLSKGNYEDINRCCDLAKKNVERYTKSTSNIMYFTIQDSDFLELQAIIYDYYYYFKMNHIMFDHFSNPKTYFEPYVQSMLCTYSPKKERERSTFWGYEPNLNEYVLKKNDLDILIKYTDSKKIKSYVKEYSISKLKFSDDSALVQKFANLCKSAMVFDGNTNLSYVNNFLFLLTKVDLQNEELKTIIDTLNTLYFRNAEKGKNALSFTIDELVNFLGCYKGDEIPLFEEMLEKLIDIEIIDYLNKHSSNELSYIYSFLFLYNSSRTEAKVSDTIDGIENINERMKMIYLLHKLFNKSQRISYKKIVLENISTLGLEELYTYIIDKFLDYDDCTENSFKKLIQEQLDEQNLKPGVMTYPDWLRIGLDYIVIFHLLGENVNLQNFDCFTSYSEPLSFLMNPKDFNYSKIKTNDYMWVNIIRNPRYFDFIKEKGDSIIPRLKKEVDNGYANERQKVLLYRYFLTEDEIREYI